LDGWVQIGVELTTEDFDGQIQDVERKINDLEEQLKIEGKFKLNSAEVSEVNAEIFKLKKQLVSLTEQKRKFNEEDLSSTGMNSALSTASNTMTDLIRKTGRWIMALFGVRGVIGLISRASSTLAQYNQQYATDLEYIRYVLAMTLAPILEWIVKVIYTILSLVNTITQALFGWNIFANASADAFARSRKSMGGMAKSAKEIAKTLSNFDEMTVLQENGGLGNAGSNIGGGGIPSQDLSKSVKSLIDWKSIWEKIKKWFSDNWPKIIAWLLTGILVVGTIMQALGKLKQKTSTVGTDVAGVFKGFLDKLGTATEIIAVLGGLTLVIYSISNLIKTFSESGLELGSVLALIATTIALVTAAFAVMALMAKGTTMESVLGIIGTLGALTLVLLGVAAVIKVLGDSGADVNDVILLLSVILGEVLLFATALALLGPILEASAAGIAIVLALVMGLIAEIGILMLSLIKALKEFIIAIAPSVIKIINAITTGIQRIIEQLGVSLPPIIYALGTMFDIVGDKIIGIIQAVAETIQTLLDGTANIIVTIGNSISQIINTIFTGMANVVSTVGRTINSVLGGISGTISSIANTVIWFINALGPSINNFANSLMRTTTRVVNFVISAIEFLLNRFADAKNKLNSSLGGILGQQSYVRIPRFSASYYAKGGIINMPNKGVPVGLNAYAGESGREGIIPLTDTQQMELLGAEIGRHVVLNAVINNTMDGRLISRQVEQVRMQQAFQSNR